MSKRKKTAKENDTVYVFKVKLAAAKRIWRRIAMLGRQTRDDLHEAIYAAYDREEEHLYSLLVREACGGDVREGSYIIYAAPAA